MLKNRMYISDVFRSNLHMKEFSLKYISFDKSFAQRYR